AETIWMSRIAMNMPKTIARKVTSFFGSIRSSGALAGAARPGPPAVRVPALAIGSIPARQGGDRDWRRCGPGASRIDARDHGHPRPQHALARDLGRDPDAHR